MKKVCLYILTVFFLICSNSFALDLQTAKSQGLVGETMNGYLGPVNPTNSEATELVQTINSKRKAKYKEIAQHRKTSLQAVEHLAGKKAIEKTPKGQYVLIKGQWKKK